MTEPPATTQSSIPNRLYTDHDLADMFNVNFLTIRKWAKNGQLPEPVVVGSRRYWRPETISKLLEPATGSI